MGKWANAILFLVNVIFLILAVGYLSTRPLFPFRSGIEYKDLITIVLTALAVILAALTIFVAVVAIWGYNSIHDASVKAAVECATIATKEVAETIASRVSASMSAVQEAGGPESDDELAAALQSGEDGHDPAGAA